MTHSDPPVLATWFLEHMRFSNTDDALAGDLLEEFNQRRSAAWYWRQVLVAILEGFASEVRHHRVLAIRAIVISWAANYGAIVLGREVMVELSRHRLPGLAFPSALASVVICFLAGAVSGLIVALLHRKHRNAVLLTCAGALPGWALLVIVFLKKGSLRPPGCRSSVGTGPTDSAAAVPFADIESCCGALLTLHSVRFRLPSLTSRLQSNKGSPAPMASSWNRRSTYGGTYMTRLSRSEYIT